RGAERAKRGKGGGGKSAEIVGGDMKEVGHLVAGERGRGEGKKKREGGGGRKGGKEEGEEREGGGRGKKRGKRRREGKRA
ncbi:hypothetical protein, partial [Salmonella enterica]|uniref:hypothetical protein n=1 Tax=Salmonella enterica TaxID=28901 RepID=UPI00398C3986